MVKNKIDIIMHAYADEDNYNAQNLNAKEIAMRLNPEIFQITLFYTKKVSDIIKKQKNINLIKVPSVRFLSSYVILENLLDKKYDII